MSNDCISTFNSLLRGERSAMETYEKASASVDHQADKIQIEELCAAHRAKVRELERHITSLGGTPDRTSGSWGVVASVVQTVANTIGDKAALYSLKEGEEHGLRSYKSALSDVAGKPKCVELINNCILAQQEHVAILDDLIETR